MQCVTSFFQRVPEAKGLWLWRVPQLFEPRVLTQADAKLLDGPGRQEYAALAADSLNAFTSKPDTTPQSIFGAVLFAISSFILFVVFVLIG